MSVAQLADEADAYAERLFGRCLCSEMDSGGDCDFCQAYYEKLNELAEQATKPEEPKP